MWGATTRRAYLRACRGRQAPRNNAPCRAGACPLRPISPSVICFANATSLVRGRLFRRFRPPYTPKTPRPVGRFHTFIGNRAVLRPLSDTNRGPPPEGSGPLLSFLMPSLSASARWRRSRCSRGCSQPRRWGTRPSGPRSGRRTAAARPRAGPRSARPPRGPACCSQ